jgi:PAS domain S-box-containing protein
MDIPMSAHPDAFDPEQEKIREALWRSEAQLALAVEVAGGVGTWDWDLKTDLIYCNKRFADLFSVDPAVAATEGVRSADYIAAIHPEDQHIVVENTQHAIATMGPYVVEFRLPQKNGSEIWIYALGHAYSDAEGNPSRFPGAAMDITQRKQMEAELKIARDQAQTILESITDGFFALDQNFCFSYMNQAGEQILGARREDLLGKCLWEFYPEVYGTQVQEEYERAIRDQKSTTFEWFFEAGNGGSLSRRIPRMRAASLSIFAIFPIKKRPKSRSDCARNRFARVPGWKAWASWREVLPTTSTIY